MSNEEAVAIQRALKDNLYETGKDFPYRDDMIPLMKESCDIAIKALEQQPCEDCISRESVIEDIIKCTDMNDDTMEVLENKVYALPSVQPSKAKGKWKWYGQGYESYPECSICNQTPKEPACDWNNVDMGDDYRYCPHCGADMRESEVEDDRTTKR